MSSYVVIVIIVILFAVAGFCTFMAKKIRQIKTEWNLRDL